jgi:K+-sensing histidine kinase KdpD
MIKIAIDLLDHWQTLFAGFLAFVAGFGTIVATIIIANKQIAASREEAKRVIAATREQTAVAQRQTETTVRLERERVASEADTLRKSLAVEIRQYIDILIFCRIGFCHG